MNARIINFGPWPPGPELPLFYTDEPARACKACHFLPAVGRRGGAFEIWCEQETCPVQPVVSSLDEQWVRGVWLVRYALREDGMTEADFQREVHYYRTFIVEKAVVDRDDYHRRGVDCVVVDFGPLMGYGLMLRRAAEAMKLPIVE